MKILKFSIVTRAARLLTTIPALVLVASAATAAPLTPPQRAEIEALLDRLQTSGCDFNRNGSWYSGTEARAHLQKKADYLDGKEMIHSAEQFIELGATGSSMSGKPYLVRCKGVAALESAPWLKAQLKALRSEHAASSPK